jgi:CheY-like chemotaxis protein
MIAAAMAVTVLIVDDHPSFRATARLLLEVEGYDVVGEAEDGRDAIRAAAELPIAGAMVVTERAVEKHVTRSSASLASARRPRTTGACSPSWRTCGHSRTLIGGLSVWHAPAGAGILMP